MNKYPVRAEPASDLGCVVVPLPSLLRAGSEAIRWQMSPPVALSTDRLRPVLSRENARTSGADASRPAQGVLANRRTRLSQSVESLLRLDSGGDDCRTLVRIFGEIQWFNRWASIQSDLALGQLCTALEAVVSALHHGELHWEISTLRSVTSALELIGSLTKPGSTCGGNPWATPSLLVSAESVATEAIAAWFEEGSASPTVCPELPQALSLAARERFECVMLNVGDYPFPGGLQACRSFRELLAGKDSLVIGFNGPFGIEQHARAADFGCSALYSGHVAWSELRLRILMQLIVTRFGRPA